MQRSPARVPSLSRKFLLIAAGLLCLSCLTPEVAALSGSKPKPDSGKNKQDHPSEPLTITIEDNQHLVLRTNDEELKGKVPDTGCYPDTSDELRPKFGKRPKFPYRPEHLDKNHHPCTDLDLHRPFVKLFYPIMFNRPYAAPLPKQVDVASPKQIARDLETLTPGIQRLLLVEIGRDCLSNDVDKPKEKEEDDPSKPQGWKANKLCYYRKLYVNIASDPKSEHKWVLALTATTDGVKIDEDLFTNLSEKITLVINGTPLTPEYRDFVFGSEDVSTYHVEAYENVDGCRKYNLKYETKNFYPEALDVEIPILKLTEQYDTGIRVGAPKVYDSFLLRSKLSNAANQLAAISPWNPTAITNAYGTLQGVTRDTSYFAAQVTTAPTPAQTLTNSLGSTTLSPTVTTTQSAQCPAGYVASPLSTTGVTCTPIAQPSCPAGYYVSSINPLVCTVLPVSAPGTQIPIATNGGQLPPGTFSSTQTNAAPQSTQVQTNIPSYSPTLPAVPTSNPLSAPTNISVSSTDMLAEQVQLNAQLQMYQMLLQGSQSDQFLVRNSMAVAPRAQTTIGFQVSLAPPRQYKHAVAEVRIVIVPHSRQEQLLAQSGEHISVVNLLPSQKTYNVAKVTSHQDAFGAGAVIEPVNVGVSTGRSKDRLYLAKDTDTVALEYPNLPTPPVTPPFPERALQELEELVKEQSIGECPNTWEGDLSALLSGSIMFGWQFRPVLGAEYVTAGPREVFAQLALPNELDQDGFAPAVYIQTRWREYDQKHQVVGPSYRDSCSWTRAQDSISILSPLRVHDVSWEDVGNGILKVHAVGKFFASGMTVMSAGTNIPPTTFDGRTIQFFAAAHDLLQNGDLMLLGENGRTIPLTNTSWADRACTIERATMKAVPRPDGNSNVELHVKYGNDYRSDPSFDGPIRPLVLIGNDVYGISTKPFQEDYQRSCHHGNACTYRFLASTDSLRSAQTALVRDISWRDFQRTIPIRIGPSFSSLSFVSTPPPSDVVAKAASDLAAAEAAAANVAASEKAAAEAAAAAKKSADQAAADKAAADKVPGDKAAQEKAAASKKAAAKAAAANTAAQKAAAEAPAAAKAAAEKAAISKAAANKPIWYALSGTGFRQIECDRPCKVYPDLRLYLDDDNPLGEPLTKESFHVVSDTTALLDISHIPKAKTLKIAWSPEDDGYASSGLPVVWDLAVPADTSDKPKVSATPAFLYTGDSETVTFTADFTGLNITDVEFEGTVLLKPDPGSTYLDPKKLAVPIPVSITKTPGHKELVADTIDQKGKAGKTILPLDVYVFRGK